MRIAIDVREACSDKPTGKGRWAQEFLRELLPRGIHTYVLFSDASVPSWMHLPHCEIRHIPLLGLRWHLRVASEIKRSSIDLYVSLTSFLVPLFLGRKKNVCITVHDMIAFMDEPHDKKATLIERLTLPNVVRTAYKIFTISDATTNDLLQRFPAAEGKTLSLYAGPTSKPVVRETSDHLSVLCISTLSPRKNQLRLIQAYQLLPEDLRKRTSLILVGGRGWNDQPIVDAARFTPGVTWLGYQTQEQCEALQAKATIVAFPSLYEGFGLPVLDAFVQGIPVLTSNRGSLKEVAGDAALMVDPLDVSSIAKGLETLLTDTTLQHELSQRGALQAQQCTWKRSVDLFLHEIAQ